MRKIIAVKGHNFEIEIDNKLLEVVKSQGNDTINKLNEISESETIEQEVEKSIKCAEYARDYLSSILGADKLRQAVGSEVDFFEFIEFAVEATNAITKAINGEHEKIKALSKAKVKI